MSDFIAVLDSNVFQKGLQLALCSATIAPLSVLGGTMGLTKAIAGVIETFRFRFPNGPGIFMSRTMYEVGRWLRSRRRGDNPSDPDRA